MQTWIDARIHPEDPKSAKAGACPELFYACCVFRAKQLRNLWYGCMERQFRAWRVCAVKTPWSTLPII